MDSKTLTSSSDQHYHECLHLMEALMNYRHQPIYHRLHKFGHRESMLHPDVLQLVYHLAYIISGAVLEIGAFRGGSTVAAALGVRDAGIPRKVLTIEPGGPLRRHPLATRDILRSLKRNLARQGLAQSVTIFQGRSQEQRIIAEVFETLGSDQLGLLIIDADGGVKRDLECFGQKLMDGCWIVIDDYGGPADKGAPTKSQVDELVAHGKLVPLGYYGFATWVGQWAHVSSWPMTR
jgi:predicted O-methyltransferase YrrM